MKKNKKILISGASIAGLTLAYWLQRYGYEVTIIERAAKPREGGSPIDVRDKAIDVAERMGILSKIQAVRTSTESIAFVNADGKTVGSIDFEVTSNNPNRDVELQRDDLVNIIYEETKGKVEFMFNNSIKTLTQDDNGVDVTFLEGYPRKFDLVVGADGLHSMVRKLIFGEEAQFAYFLGMYVAVFEVSPTLGRKNTGMMYNSPGKLAGIYCYHNRADAILAFRSPKIDYDYHDLSEQKRLIANAFAGESWKIPELLDILRKAEKFYFDPVCQIRMPSWTKGRVAVIGDAAHCAAFLSGKGITLAMLGATMLADELNKAEDDHIKGFIKYEETLRPIVEPIQLAVPGSAWVLVPKTRFIILLRNLLTRLSPIVKALRSLKSKK